MIRRGLKMLGVAFSIFIFPYLVCLFGYHYWKDMVRWVLYDSTTDKKSLEIIYLNLNIIEKWAIGILPTFIFIATFVLLIALFFYCKNYLIYGQWRY